MNDNQNEGKARGEDEDTTSEVFIGCCEMETDTWACGTCATLFGTHVHTRGIDNPFTEYLYVCVPCSKKYREKP